MNKHLISSGEQRTCNLKKKCINTTSWNENFYNLREYLPFQFIMFKYEIKGISINNNILIKY